MAEALDRDDIIDGLRDLAQRARAAGIRGSTLRIVVRKNATGPKTG